MDARTIEKMTVKKLREEALQIPNIVGIHGMKKDELVDTLKEHFGIQLAKKKGKEQSIKQIKYQINELKSKRLEAIAGKDGEKSTRLRKKIKRMKRRTRILAKS